MIDVLWCMRRGADVPGCLSGPGASLQCSLQCLGSEKGTVDVVFR